MHNGASTTYPSEITRGEDNMESGKVTTVKYSSIFDAVRIKHKIPPREEMSFKIFKTRQEGLRKFPGNILRFSNQTDEKIDYKKCTTISYHEASFLLLASCTPHGKLAPWCVQKCLRLLSLVVFKSLLHHPRSDTKYINKQTNTHRKGCVHLYYS